MTSAARTGDLGGLVPPGFSPYPDNMDIITDASQLPKDRATISDESVINAAAWAALQGVAVETVYRNKTKSDKRRGTPDARPGDMPAEDGRMGHGPYWFVRTYRAWDAARPGRGAGAGRPVGSGRGRAVKVALPIACPHCHQEVTRESLGLDESGRPAAAAVKTNGRPAVRSGGRKRPALTGGRAG